MESLFDLASPPPSAEGVVADKRVADRRERKARFVLLVGTRWLLGETERLLVLLVLLPLESIAVVALVAAFLAVVAAAVFRWTGFVVFMGFGFGFVDVLVAFVMGLANRFLDRSGAEESKSLPIDEAVASLVGHEVAEFAHDVCGEGGNGRFENRRMEEENRSILGIRGKPSRLWSLVQQRVAYVRMNLVLCYSAKNRPSGESKRRDRNAVMTKPGTSLRGKIIMSKGSWRATCKKRACESIGFKKKMIIIHNSSFSAIELASSKSDLLLYNFSKTHKSKKDAIMSVESL
jgi:hypothetical protein